jgi:hypothetical protein
MMRKKTVMKILGVSFALTVGVAWAKGDWSAARSKAEDFKRDQQSLKKMTPDETRRIVTAICEARSTKERREVGREIASRVKDGVKDSYERLERTKNEAIKLLDDVLEDPDLAGNHSDARQWKDEVNERWEMIGRMTAALRGGNHPVVSFMSEQGVRAHKEKQDNCDAKEFELKSGIADCINATGETCTVVELKPDNSKAISDGIDQYKRRYVPELNEELKKSESDIMKKLINKDSDFAKCKRFEGRVDCYKLCPDVNEDGTIREQNASWRSDCS